MQSAYICSFITLKGTCCCAKVMRKCSQQTDCCGNPFLRNNFTPLIMLCVAAVKVPSCQHEQLFALRLKKVSVPSREHIKNELP